MQVSGSVIANVVLLGLVVGLAWRSWQPPLPAENRQITLTQNWSMQPGDQIGGYRITGSLGDVSVELNGRTAYAPFDGEVEANRPGCVLYSTDRIPAYLFRLCGLQNPRLGAIRQGEAIGSGKYLQFATLRREPNGTWAFVETSRSILIQILKQP